MKTKVVSSRLTEEWLFLILCGILWHIIMKVI